MSEAGVAVMLNKTKLELAGSSRPLGNVHMTPLPATEGKLTRRRKIAGVVGLVAQDKEALVLAAGLLTFCSA